MGAFGGVWRFHGGPVDSAWITRVGESLARRAPNPPLSAVGDGIAVVFRPYGDVPLTGDRSPGLWRSPSGGVLAFDGRVDNLPDLSRMMGLTGDQGRSRGAVLLAGFIRKGPSFAGDIVGDFALAYWDPSSHRLTLGRDPVGVRMLYCHLDTDSVAFATDLGSLVKTRHAGSTLDDEYIAGFFLGAPDASRTVYRSITCIRPGSVLIITGPGAMRWETAWALNPEPHEITYKTDREYEEQFRALFQEAVQVRLSTPDPVVAELSGGMDSSSIVCMADHILRTKPTQVTPTLVTSTRILDRSSSGDESRFRIPVERQCERPHVYCLESEVPNVKPMNDVDELFVPMHLAVCSGYERSVCADMRQLGAKTLLSGIGGDEMFQSTSKPVPGLADLWVRHRYWTLHKGIRDWSVALKMPYYRLLWASFEEGQLYRRKRLATSVAPPSWVHPRLHDTIRAIRQRREDALKIYPFPSHREHAFAFSLVVELISSGERQDFDARTISFPFLHRPLVEFAQAVPFTQKLRIGENRSLQRRGLRGILPDELVRRRGKGNPQEVYLREVREHVDEMKQILTNPIAESLGFIRSTEARAALDKMAAGLRTGDTAPFAACALELWLRSHMEGESAKRELAMHAGV